MVAHFTDLNAGLFHNFTTHGFFDIFTRLDKTREAGIHVLGEHRLTTDQTLVTAHGEHNHYRVGAGEVFGVAGIVAAFAHIAGIAHFGFLPTNGTETVARVPVENGLGGAQG